jgi:ABC-2 type transport system permease protein
MTTTAIVTGSQIRIRLGAVVRHQVTLIARDPGPMLGYVIMGILLITVNRGLYAALGRLLPGVPPGGIDQAASGMAVMFSLFALKVGAAHLLDERTWHTWDRLQATPARFGELLAGKSLPIYGAIVIQQLILFGYSAAAFGLRPAAGWWALLGCGLIWSACVLLLGSAASTLARSPAQLSAAGDVFAILTTVLGGALVPVALLPSWLRPVAPVSSGYWAMRAYQTALTGQPGALARPLAVLGLFSAAGIIISVLVGARQTRHGRSAMRKGTPAPRRSPVAAEDATGS